MSVSSDILESWRRPKVVVRKLMSFGRSEPFASTLLLTGLILLYISLAPFLAREAYFHPEQPLPQRMVGAALAVAATVPLWYALAALGHLVARLMGGQGSFYGGRIALFWALVATAPLFLITGLVQGMLGLGLAANILGLAAAASFLVFWSVMLREVEFP
jgi:Yip1 domain